MCEHEQVDVAWCRDTHKITETADSPKKYITSWAPFFPFSLASSLFLITSVCIFSPTGYGRGSGKIWYRTGGRADAAAPALGAHDEPSRERRGDERCSRRGSVDLMLLCCWLIARPLHLKVVVEWLVVDFIWGSGGPRWLRPSMAGVGRISVQCRWLSDYDALRAASVWKWSVQSSLLQQLCWLWPMQSECAS